MSEQQKLKFLPINNKFEFCVFVLMGWDVLIIILTVKWGITNNVMIRTVLMVAVTIMEAVRVIFRVGLPNNSLNVNTIMRMS